LHVQMLHIICSNICYTFNVLNPEPHASFGCGGTRRLIIKSKDRMWPTVIWQGTQLVIYYLGEDEDDVEVRETHGIDFEEFFLHLDRGGSVFVTMKPRLVEPEEGDDDESPDGKPRMLLNDNM
jgi:hypothetical protein